MTSFRDAVRSQNNLAGGKAFRDQAPTVDLLANGETPEEAHRGQFRRGFDIGSNNLKKGAFNALRAFGDQTGVDPLTQFGAEGAERASLEASALPQLAQPKIQDVESVEDILDWAAGGLGQAVPSLGATAGGAVLGAAAAAATPLTLAVGAGTGAFLASSVPEMGHTYADIEDATGEKAFWTALATGGAIGAIDTLAAGKLLKAGVPNSVVAKLTRGEALDQVETGAVKNIAGTMLTEGGTEAAQGFVGNVGRATQIEGLDPLSEEAISNYINEAAIGALVGGTIGTAGSVAKAGAGKAAEGVEAIQERLPAPRQDEDVPVSVRELPEELQNLGKQLSFRVDEQGDATFDSRGAVGLRQAAQDGSLADVLRSRGMDEDAIAEHVQDVDDAMFLAEKYLQRPDLAPAPEQIAAIEAVLNNPINKALFQQFDAVDADADANLDAVIETADDRGSLEENFQQTLDEGAASLDINPFDINAGATQDQGADLRPMMTGVGTEQRPVISLAASNKAAGSAHTENSVTRAIKQFNERNKGKGRQAREISYGDYIERIARQDAAKENLKGPELEAFVADRISDAAKRSWQAHRNAGTKALDSLDVSNPRAFLDSFSAMEVEQTQEQAAGASDPNTLTADDLAVTKNPTKEKLEAAGGHIEPAGKGLLHEMPKGDMEGKLSQGFVAVEVEGRKTPVRLDAVKLTQLFRNKARSPQRANNTDLSSKEQIADAFYRGMAQLMTTEGRNVKFSQGRDIPDALVVFRGKDNVDVTYGEIKNMKSPGKKAHTLEKRLRSLINENSKNIEQEQEAEPGSNDRKRATDRVEKTAKRIETTQRAVEEAQREEASASAPDPDKKKAEKAEEEAEDARTLDDNKEVTGIPEESPALAEPVKHQLTDGYNFDHKNVLESLPKAKGDPNYQAAYAAALIQAYIKHNRLIPKQIIQHAQSLLPHDSPQRFSVNPVSLVHALNKQSKLSKDTLGLIAEIRSNKRLLRAMGYKKNEAPKVSEIARTLNEFADQLEKRVGKLRTRTDQRKDTETYVGAVLDFMLKDSESKKALSQAQKQADDWAKQLGIPGVPVLQGQAMRDFLQSHPEGASLVNRMAEGELFGAKVTLDDGTPAILLNPLVDPLTMSEQLAHEMGHVAKDHLASRVTEAQANQIIKEFEAWASHLNKETSLYEALGSKKTKRARLAAMMGHTSQVKLEELTPDDQAYLTSFDEWFADRVANQLVRQPSERTESGAAINKLIRESAAILKQIFGGNEDIDVVMAMVRDGEMQTIMQKAPTEEDAFAAVLSGMPELTDMKFSVGIENQMDPMEEMNRRVQQRLGKSLDELAQTQKSMTRAQFNERVIALAYVNRAKALSRLNRVMMTWALDNAMVSAQETAVLGRLAQDPRIKAKLVKRLEADPAALAEVQDPVRGTRAAVGYLYQFHMMDPEGFPLTPKSRGIFDRIRKVLLDIAGIVDDTDLGAQIVRAMEGGELILGQRTFTLRPAIQNNAFQTGIQKAIKYKEWFDKRYNVLLGANSVMLRSGVPALQRLAAEFDNYADTIGNRETFNEERTERVNKYVNQLNRIFKDASKQQVEDTKTLLFDYVNKVGSADPEVKALADQTLLMLHDLFGFYQQSGVAGTGKKDLNGKFVGMGKRGAVVTVNRPDGTPVEVRAYFPWVLDMDKFAMGGTERFSRMMHRPEYEKQLNEMLNNANASRAIDGLEPLSKQDLIDQMIRHMMNEGGTVEAELDPSLTGHTPKMTAYNPRTWAWITETTDPDNPVSQESIADWQSLQNDSLYGIMHSYIEQGVKRSIYTKRFGRNGHKLNRIIEQARKEGADDKDIRNAEKYIDAMLGTYGNKTNVMLHEAWNKVREIAGKPPLDPPKPGQPINPKLQKVTQWMMVYQNFRILDFAVLTSLMDPVGIFSRSGDPKMFLRGLKHGFKDVYDRRIKGNETMINSVAEQLGIVENHVISEALQWNYSGTFMSGTARKANDAFFRYNGLQGWTRMTRIMATSAAQQFIKYHSGNPEAHSERYMQELGLQSNDIQPDMFTETGDIKLMSEQDFNALVEQSRGEGEAAKTAKANLEREQRIRTAIIRFTNEAVLRPNAAQRPIWASDPHFAVVFHLKQFVWSFHTRILGRMVHEAQFGQLSPVMYAALTYMAVMAGADAMREYLKYGSEGNPRTADWGFSDYAWHSIQRAGLTGTYQAMIDADSDTQYGGFGFESFMGPSLNQAWQVLKVPFKEDSNAYMEKQLDRALPFNNFRDMLGLSDTPGIAGNN